MSDPALEAQIDAARAYEALFVPALFGQWAKKVAVAAEVKQGQKVLDVACGTGVLARDSEAEISTEKGTARFPSIRTMVEADLRGWLPVMGVFLAEDQIEAILNEAETALRSYADDDGHMTFEVSAHIVAAGRGQ